jgi:hypothetical protein
MAVAMELVAHALHLARETHTCTARPATGVPVTTFSLWRLFSEELPIADLPGIMMRPGARHLKRLKTPILSWLPFSKSSLWCYSWFYSLMPSSVGCGQTPGISFLPGDIKYESPGGNVRVYFPIVTSIVLSVVLTLILSLFGRFFGR